VVVVRHSPGTTATIKPARWAADRRGARTSRQLRFEVALPLRSADSKTRRGRHVGTDTACVVIGRLMTCKKVVNVTAAMKTVAINWTQLSVGCILLLQLVFLSQGDSASETQGDDGRLLQQTSSSSSSSSQSQQRNDDDLSSLPANCTARQVLQSPSLSITLSSSTLTHHHHHHHHCRPTAFIVSHSHFAL